MKDHHTLMTLAIQQAEHAATRGEVPVGAVLVDPNGHILAADGNRMREWQDPTAHAEMVVIRQGTKKLDQWRLDGCTLYVTLEPCAMCAGAIAAARIKTLVYGACDPKGGGVAHGGKLYSQPTCHHRPKVESGIEAGTCRSLLKSFFKARR